MGFLSGLFGGSSDSNGDSYSSTAAPLSEDSRTPSNGDTFYRTGSNSKGSFDLYRTPDGDLRIDYHSGDNSAPSFEGRSYGPSE